MLYSIAANVSDDTLKAIGALEKETGKTFIAFSGLAVKPSALSVEEVSKIEEIEKKLGLSLVAVEN